MAGVPDFVSELGWWAVWIFLIFVVFFRAQGTYWLFRWARRGADAVAHSGDEARDDDDPVTSPGLASRIAARMTGPKLDRVESFLERWGFIGIPLSFLTVGFQTLVNGGAGYMRMRWDLYTIAMLPGCVLWASWYTLLFFSLAEAWARSPWLALGIVGVIVLIYGAYVVTRRRQTAGSVAHTSR